MTSRFLRKYKLNSSMNGNIKDLELVHPINKSIKATQVYIDASVSPTFEHHHIRVASQSPKISSSLILEPLCNAPKLSSSIIYDNYQEDKVRNTEYLKNSLNHFDKKLSRREEANEYRISSQIHPIRPIKRIFL
ncbi:hypothetical protein SteCoe_872 [Stentor coeruleus]|uniref:Uncharacterized protein n=1 Tax=Stentor coeruleus TaxID=5963 RepID=A0A1R2D332_9CILI|nr:hypothetical protein SteCoe_872 [Stentor coeruleus]